MGAGLDAVTAFLPDSHECAARGRRWTAAEAEALLPTGMTASAVIEQIITRYASPQHWWRSAWSCTGT